MADFNKLASFYDLLKKIVFQSDVDKASSYFIPFLPDEANVLIVGGGTGELLTHFKETHTIVYIEQSSKMIARARKRKFVASVDFKCVDVTDYHVNHQYDYVITPFVLDCFPAANLVEVFKQLSRQLKCFGHWIQTDFYPQGKWQDKLVALMYFFFRKTAGLRLSKIQNFDLLFAMERFEEKKNVRFKRGLIQSKYYQKIA